MINLHNKSVDHSNFLRRVHSHLQPPKSANPAPPLHLCQQRHRSRGSHERTFCCVPCAIRAKCALVQTVRREAVNTLRIGCVDASSNYMNSFSVGSGNHRSLGYNHGWKAPSDINWTGFMAGRRYFAARASRSFWLIRQDN